MLICLYVPLPGRDRVRVPTARHASPDPGFLVCSARSKTKHTPEWHTLLICLYVHLPGRDRVRVPSSRHASPDPGFLVCSARSKTKHTPEWHTLLICLYVPLPDRDRVTCADVAARVTRPRVSCVLRSIKNKEFSGVAHFAHLLVRSPAWQRSGACADCAARVTRPRVTVTFAGSRRWKYPVLGRCGPCHRVRIFPFGCRSRRRSSSAPRPRVFLPFRSSGPAHSG